MDSNSFVSSFPGKTRTLRHCLIAAAVTLPLSLTATAFAEAPVEKETPAAVTAVTSEDIANLPSSRAPIVDVIGSKGAALNLPGSGFYLDSQDINQQSYDDINRVLRKVPGVYVREEEGFGLFPNISIRGVDTIRSSKITMMEDAIPIAPAPYSAPEAYMSPTVARMSAIEVLKGSSQIQYGPHTTGGVINYISTPIPAESAGYLKALYGTDNDVRLHAHYGSTFDLGSAGNFGFLIEGYLRSNDGFQEYFSAPDFRGDDTGLMNVEPMVKLMWEPDSEQYQRFEFKLGYTDRDAEQTYLGLSEADFNDDPYKRYAASRFDVINSYQTRMYMRHFIEATENLSISTTLYYNRFHRNWYKLNDLRNIDTDGDGVGNGLNLGIPNALAGASGGLGLDVLQGMRAGDLRVRANNRDYYSYGISIDPTLTFNTGDLEHEMKFGFRYHNDRVRRFQHDDIYEQASDGSIADNDGDDIAFNPGTPGSESNRREQTDAFAFYVRDEISFGKWTVTPGIRAEYLELENKNFAAPAQNGDESMFVFSGGVGVTYDWCDEVTLFGGVHRGVSPPGPIAAIVNELDEEWSIAIEGGLRYNSKRGAFSAEVTGFYTYFDDLIVIDNIGGGGTGDSENVGRVDSFGVELFVQYDPGIAYNWGFNMPNFISFTYTNAELASDSDTADAESIFAGGVKGNKVPYIPEYLLTIGTGIEIQKFGFFFTGSYVSSTYTTASNTDSLTNGVGTPDSRFGKLDSHFVVDLSAYYQVADNAKILAGVHNLFGEEYVASRHPNGPRPGMPTFGYVGLEVTF